jgi:hypothetical protein
MHRLDGHLDLNELDIQGSLLFDAPKATGVAVSVRRQTTKTHRGGVQLELFRTIWRGSKVASIYLSHGLGNQKNVGHSGLPNSSSWGLTNSRRL